MGNSYLVLDIETINDAQLPLSEGAEIEGLPPPPHHRIVAIGVLWLDRDYKVRRIGVFGEDKDERGTLIDFTRFVDERRPDLITYNGRGFDMPVIAARCLRHGVPFRHYYSARDVRYRFSAEGHLDLMDYISDFGAAKRSKLDVVAKLCGMPGKVGVDGKDVGPLVFAGRLEEVRNYCLCDVLQTTAVFLRVQLVRGEIEPEHYVEAMTELMETARADERLAAVTRAWDEPRLLLQTADSSTGDDDPAS